MIIKRQYGLKAVTIEEDEYGITLAVMMNGWQSTVCEVDHDIMVMLAHCIDEYAENRGGMGAGPLNIHFALDLEKKDADGHTEPRRIIEED